MMAKQSIFKLTLGMFLSALVVAGIVQVNHEQGLKNHYQSFEVYTGHMRIKDYEFINDGEAVVTHFSAQGDKDYQMMKKYGKKSVIKETSRVPVASRNGYLIFYNRALKNPDTSKIKYDKGEYKELMIYKKEGNQLIEKRLDLIKLEEKIGYKIGDDRVVTNNIGLVKLKNNHIGLYLYPPDYKVLDLNTYEIISDAQVQENISKNNTLFTSILMGVNSETNYFNKVGLSGGISIANIKKSGEDRWEKLDKLPIAQKYPKAFDLLKEENSFISLMADSNSSQDELHYAVNILSLFYSDGIDGLFQKVKIVSSDSKDGKDHVVTSYDEFKQYYKFKE